MIIKDINSKKKMIDINAIITYYSLPIYVYILLIFLNIVANVL